RTCCACCAGSRTRETQSPRSELHPTCPGSAPRYGPPPAARSAALAAHRPPDRSGSLPAGSVPGASVSPIVLVILPVHRLHITSAEAGLPHLAEDYLVLSTIHSAKGQEWDELSSC